MSNDRGRHALSRSAPLRNSLTSARLLFAVLTLYSTFSAVDSLLISHYIHRCAGIATSYIHHITYTHSRSSHYDNNNQQQHTQPRQLLSPFSSTIPVPFVSTHHPTMYTSTLGLFAAALAAAVVNVQAATTCNGYSELVSEGPLRSSKHTSSFINSHHRIQCSKTYSNVTYIGTHDSYSVSSGSLAANQNYTVTTQLNNGVRLLQNQVHNSSGVLHLCHTSCVLLDAGTVENYLTEVKSWLDSNPNEVISMLWVNSDDV